MIFAHQNLISNRLTYLVHAKSTDELIYIWIQRSLSPNFVLSKTLSKSLSPNEKRLHFLADLWSQSEFRTQRKSQRKTNPKSEMTRALMVDGGRLAAWLRYADYQSQQSLKNVLSQCI